MKLNENIYKLRKEKGLSQETLAENIGVSRQTISNWELGETSPNPEQLILLSKTLNTSVDCLLGNSEKTSDIKGRLQNENTKYIFFGSVIICGCLSSILSFTANRFTDIEIVEITIAGLAVGFGIALFINGITKEITNIKPENK